MTSAILLVRSFRFDSINRRRISRNFRFFDFLIENRSSRSKREGNQITNIKKKRAIKRGKNNKKKKNNNNEKREEKRVKRVPGIVAVKSISSFVVRLRFGTKICLKTCTEAARRRACRARGASTLKNSGFGLFFC